LLTPSYPVGDFVQSASGKDLKEESGDMTTSNFMKENPKNKIPRIL